MKIIRKLQVAMLTIAVIGATAVEGNARDRAIDGLIVGAGSGALVGQAIGRDAEATLIGTAVGGMLGYIAGNEMARDSYGRGYAPVQAGLYLPHPPIPQVVFSYNRGDYRRDGYRPHHRSSRECWEKVVKVERRHGRYREVVKTVCRDRDRWRDRDHHGYWRDGHRGRDRW
jgi:hypothetical protein